MARGSGCTLSLMRVGCIPVLVGGALGFILVAWLLRPGFKMAPVPAQPAPTASPTPPAQVIILLLGPRGEHIVGFWYWGAGPPGLACIAANNSFIEPQYKELGAIMTDALAVEDASWVAENARHLKTGCAPALAPAGGKAQVIFVSQAGFVALVDALGGIELEGVWMDGGRVWEQISSPSTAANQVQLQQQAIWLALAARAKTVPHPACEHIQNTAALFDVAPPTGDACHQLEWVIRQTPSVVHLP